MPSPQFRRRMLMQGRQPVPWLFVGRDSTPEVASGNITLVEPAGVQATGLTVAQGDLMVAWIGYRGTANFTLPAGWILVAQETSANVDVGTTTSISSGVMAYIVRGASTPSVIFTRTAGDVAKGVISVYRNHNRESPLGVFSQNTLAVASTLATTGALVTSRLGELIVAGCAAARNTTSSAFDAATGVTVDSGASSDLTTHPMNNAWRRRTDLATSVGADMGMAIADAVMASPGGTGTIQATCGTSARHVMIAAAFRSA